MNKHQK